MCIKVAYESGLLQNLIFKNGKYNLGQGAVVRGLVDKMTDSQLGGS